WGSRAGRRASGILRVRAAGRAQQYQAMQKAVLANSPFVILFEKVAQVATAPGVSGLAVGPINDLVSYRQLKK
ncbi:hypothetical protein PPH41_42415, partial [Burkholderia gladioli]|nr:hypothetical protein [Burkholderia gladioli]